MNKETKTFVERMIIKDFGRLPNNQSDWIDMVKQKEDNHSTLAYLIEALDIYKEE